VSTTPGQPIKAAASTRLPVRTTPRQYIIVAELENGTRVYLSAEEGRKVYGWVANREYATQVDHMRLKTEMYKVLDEALSTRFVRVGVELA
jgi:hypothetical protein